MSVAHGIADATDSVRKETAAARIDAVERVVHLMRERLGESHTLEELAGHAYLSPFHFNRIFRQATGAPPGRFLTALRLHAAKRLLLTTSMTVTDVCMTVGYSSLGTFTTQFKSMVGVPPRRLRQLVGSHADEPVCLALERVRSRSRPDVGAPVTGTIVCPPTRHVLVGLFPTAVPQGSPVACTSMEAPGFFRIDNVPDGTYHVLACGFPTTATLLDVVLSGPAPDAVVGAVHAAVHLGRSSGPVHIQLRPPTGLQPPILSALPLLLISGVEPDAR